MLNMKKSQSMQKKLIDSVFKKLKDEGYKPCCVIMTHSFYNSLIEELEEANKDKELISLMDGKFKTVEVYRSRDVKDKKTTKHLYKDRHFVIY